MAVNPPGGGTTTPAVGAHNYTAGEVVTITATSASGYHFVNWTGDVANSNSASTTVTMDANKTVTANFELDVATYTLTYNANTGTGAIPTDANHYLQGATVTVLGNTGSLLKAGSTFTGWNTLANGLGTSRAAGSTFAMGTANVILYAQWTANPTYTVTYNANTGTGAVPTDANLYQQGALVTVLGQGSLLKAGYAFTGWNTLANGTGTDRAAGSTFAMGTANVILYAQWTANGTVSDSIVIYGDPQNSSNHPDVVDDVLAIDPVAVLIVGDLVNNASSTTEWTTFNNLVSDYNQLYTARGNHDGGTNWQGNYDNKYSVNINLDSYTIHLIVLDTNDGGGMVGDISDTQKEWLVEDLINHTSADFTICGFHHPVYSNGSHGGSTALQTKLVPLFESYGVDMVFYGHDHYCERTTVNDIYYVQTCGGDTRDGHKSNFCKLFINDDDELAGEVYDVSGTLLGSFQSSRL
jgi:uncharacterized repeat protein (TIGR02543 family)